eukprot:CAMPEP_0180237088 /NCGR_PEP_ID=MMETSP0987-20121128/30156_1 /TAXON_ID=697907 /ORGANISM="non described non described, Strain CCMP2293" /LENGTH=296 /DNA_ID=CAMNT_0022203417 /DNA_START=131 /DNA_END=1018 /DNA_ORIENTATION=-
MVLDGEDALGEGSFFWCKDFMWHGITGLTPGEHSANFVLWEGVPTPGGARVEVAHTGVHFQVVQDHGRFFGVRDVTIVDAAPTAAFFRSPANRSSVLLDQDGTVTLRLVAQNFVPGQRDFAFRITHLASGEEVETRAHSLALRLQPGRHCLEVSAVNDQGEQVGLSDDLCFRALPTPTPDASCDAAGESISQGLVKSIVIVDDRDCSAALKLAEWCSSCDVVLCAAWELEGPEDEDAMSTVNLTASAEDYSKAVNAKLRRISLQEVPYLEEHSVDAFLIRHSRVESAVDQLAELES